MLWSCKGCNPECIKREIHKYGPQNVLPPMINASWIGIELYKKSSHALMQIYKTAQTNIVILID